MSDLVVLAEKNELALVPAEQARIIRLIKERAVTPLAPEREMGPFLLFSVGDDLETIAAKTNFPKDIIVATAIHYRWPEKIKLLSKEGLNPAFLQKELANTLLVATYQSMITDLGLVVAGKKSAKDVGLIPKNITALQSLMEMVSKLNTPSALPVPTQTTVIHAENVQVNNQLGDKPSVTVDDPKRAEMLKFVDS